MPNALFSRFILDDPSACWPLPNPSTNGYARVRWNDRQVYAHRAAYEFAYGPIPAGMHVDHTCHNVSECAGGPTCPHRACVNPNHLEAVEPAVNVTRGAAARTRANPSCPKGHSPSEMGKEGRGWRACEACARERSAQVRIEMKAGIRPVKMGECVNCAADGKIMARGLCNACYLRQYRAAKRAS